MGIKAHLDASLEFEQDGIGEGEVRCLLVATDAVFAGYLAAETEAKGE